MNLDLTDEETAALLKELDSLIDGDRYFLSMLRAIRAKIKPEPVREPLPPPPKRYQPPRARDDAPGAEQNLATRSKSTPQSGRHSRFRFSRWHIYPLVDARRITFRA
jgi:hypothetical protein